MIYRIFVEKREGFRVAADKLKSDVVNVLGIGIGSIREILRYDAEGLEREDFERAVTNVFSEPPCDEVWFETLPVEEGASVFAVEYLPGQYDQRADSASQCIQLLTRKPRPAVRCARVYVVTGASAEEISRIKKYLINPVEAREASLEKPSTLRLDAGEAPEVPVVKGFTGFSDAEIADYHRKNGFAMSVADLAFVRDYYKKSGRDPVETEIKVIDTYWSDHCRHTTFLTELSEVEIESENPHVRKAYELYRELFAELYAGRTDKYPCLMDIATIGTKKLKKEGVLKNLDESDEINACSIEHKVDVNGKDEDYLIMFKNETHNHPTEIEPFGGAATCLGGAIRDPLSGRTYVYQSMRVTGAADPTLPLSETLKGKLPQRVLTKTAASGFSSYGNQIGLATGIVSEVYHPNFVAKRLETGFVVAAAPKKNIFREKPVAGDVVILLGGDTGRDGCGGATGSSKVHTLESVETCGAEVQKGNPLTERKIQRLFRKFEVTSLIKKCNDFGAGGVSVAIGELADGLDINLDLVSKKYEGLNATELAISESQERMAVVVRKQDADKFISLCAEENLNAAVVATVTDTRRMRMFFRGARVVDIERDFLDTNGVKQSARAKVVEPKSEYLQRPNAAAQNLLKTDRKAALLAELGRLNVCSQKGLTEIFDSTIGAGSVYLPLGGARQLTPAISMAAKVPTEGETDTCTVCAYGFDPELMEESCFAGAVYSVVASLNKLVASGVNPDTVYLTLQEYFRRLKEDPERWGKPMGALLGALYAEISLKKAAIGGKDSMSGTFENIDVPNTLISFALGVAKASELITNVLPADAGKLYLIKTPKDAYNIPEFSRLTELNARLHAEIKRGNVRFATVTEEGGAFAAVVKSGISDRVGFSFARPAEELLAPGFADYIISAKDISAFADFECVVLGEVAKDGYDVEGVKLSFDEAEQAFCAKLEGVFPTRAAAKGEAKPADFALRQGKASETRFAKPRVVIPVFPGTNCERDSARAFERAGAVCREVLVLNRSVSDIEESVKRLNEALAESQIVMFPGGFSGGDEPDGSGKFIATTFRNPAIRDAVIALLARDGLALGICNGFQALIKLGLVPYGEIRELEKDSPTLTFNNISRHVSTVARIRVASVKSPWFAAVNVGDVYDVAISHGEGRFAASESEIARLAENGQIATQYCDLEGRVTMASPFNPNGSAFAVEGITSADGRILGKMGHSERIGGSLYRNYAGNFDMKIFESGVKYFR